MKLLKATTLSCLLMLLTTGCSISSESPEQLVKDRAIYNEENKLLYDGINKKLLTKSSKLILPSNSTEVGKINTVDLDNDGIDEIVAFEKKENLNEDKSQVGLLVLSEKNSEDKKTYIVKGDNLQDGDSIEYADFYDIDGDEVKEIVLLIKDGDKTNLHIYRYKEESISLIYTLDCYWIDNSSELSDTRVKIGKLDNDNIVDILILQQNQKTNKMYASVGNFLNDKFKVRDYVEFENVKNISDIYITVGNIATSKKGIILDIPTFKENRYMTQIIYMEDNKLKKAFLDDRVPMKSYYIAVEDINKDKVLDIPIVNTSGQVYSSKNSANISWSSWNGKEGEYSELVFTSQIYYNYQYNFKIFIPNNLANRFGVESEYNNDIVNFRFYYYDVETSEPKTLFIITAHPKTIGDDNNKIVSQVGVILKETDDYTFILQVNNESELKKLYITIDTLKESFSLIY